MENTNQDLRSIASKVGLGTREFAEVSSITPSAINQLKKSPNPVKYKITTLGIMAKHLELNYDDLVLMSKTKHLELTHADLITMSKAKHLELTHADLILISKAKHLGLTYDDLVLMSNIKKSVSESNKQQEY